MADTQLSNDKPDHLKLGQWGEEIACQYLKNKGYNILERNFRKRWGEIDIICRVSLETIKKNTQLTASQESDVIHNKNAQSSTSHKLSNWFYKLLNKFFNKPSNSQKSHKIATESFYKSPVFSQIRIPHRTSNNSKLVFIEVKTLKTGNLNPEDNMTWHKQHKLIRICQSYLAYNHLDLDVDWQIDVVAISVDPILGRAKIRHYENAVY